MNSAPEPESTDDAALPVGLAAVWGHQERPATGPRRSLDLDRIVGTAVELAGSDGLSAVSMVRLGKALSVSPMALYRYVTSKVELLDLMLDAGFGPAPAAPADAGWRDGLASWAWDCLAAWRRHPWMLQINVTGPPMTPNQIGWLERGLTSLADTGLSRRSALSVVMMLSGLVRSWAGLAVGMDADDGTAAAGYAATLARLIDPDRFPAVVAAMTEGAIDDDTEDNEDEFHFQLDRVLDGVQVLIDRGPDA